VIDSCNNIIHDTVDVVDAPPIPFNVGPDRIKCNADTIHLEAPTGFMNYAWGPAYNITGNSTRVPVVTPLLDTVYTIKAELSPGCFAFDTIRIKVNVSPPIHLGNDTSFCEGGKVLLDAGAGFNTYQWSNNINIQQQQVTTVGNYSVIGTTVQGCRSYDTLKVLQVYPNPVVTLADKPGICEGETLKLDAGNFATYAWSTGAAVQTIDVNAPGKYYVTVKDPRGCQGSDTTIVPVILPVPAGFLPVDTSICQYGTLLLKSIQSYNSYLWSNSQTGNAITISKPGEYWLQVTDKYQCKGRDTILVNPKECMEGFYIPSAFTPDGDGKNDLFYPLVFGEVKDYHFTVFNRWGEKVFESKQLGKGWNGMTGSLRQDSNVFVWTCSYTLAGKERKLEKGSVMLIR
jgi:gliding motility-associated-like protein